MLLIVRFTDPDSVARPDARYADRRLYTCSSCGAVYRVNFRNVVQATLPGLIGAVAGLPLWFLAV